MQPAVAEALPPAPGVPAKLRSRQAVAEAATRTVPWALKNAKKKIQKQENASTSRRKRNLGHQQRNRQRVVEAVDTRAGCTNPPLGRDIKENLRIALPVI
jgi:hypothetical protein